MKRQSRSERACVYLSPGFALLLYGVFGALQSGSATCGQACAAALACAGFSLLFALCGGMFRG